MSAGLELGKSAKNVLAAAKGQSWQAEDLEMANAWPLLPVLEAQGSVGLQQDWTAMLTNTAPDLYTPGRLNRPITGFLRPIFWPCGNWQKNGI